MRTLAFYLPQYHAIPENNEWWGPGFTEWTNVAPARPRFAGHYQPHVPADLGFYDLRLNEVREAQAAMASAHGVDGFCYYHYWFEGRRLLNTPLDMMLASGAPDFPFCLCWANESWARNWDGLENQVLVKQTYSADDHQRHIEWLLKVFADRRYIRVNERPVMIVYRPASIPKVEAMVAGWRKAAAAAGFPGLYLVAVRSGFDQGTCENTPSSGVFDAVLDFQPNRDDFQSPVDLQAVALEAARNLLPNRLYQALKSRGSAVKRVDYAALAEFKIAQLAAATAQGNIPCVFPSWDNTPRRATPTVIQNDDPALFGRWVAAAAKAARLKPPGEQLLFINAWNEWAEGCHLEPDRRFGKAYMQAMLSNVHGTNHV